MPSTLIKNARVVNEGVIIEADLRIVDERIERIAREITAQSGHSLWYSRQRFYSRRLLRRFGVS